MKMKPLKRILILQYLHLICNLEMLLISIAIEPPHIAQAPHEYLYSKYELKLKVRSLNFREGYAKSDPAILRIHLHKDELLSLDVLIRCIERAGVQKDRPGFAKFVILFSLFFSRI